MKHTWSYKNEVILLDNDVWRYLFSCVTLYLKCLRDFGSKLFLNNTKEVVGCGRPTSYRITTKCVLLVGLLGGILPSHDVPPFFHQAQFSISGSVQRSFGYSLMQTNVYNVEYSTKMFTFRKTPQAKRDAGLHKFAQFEND